MQRIPEPDLMNDPEQARAYAEADFTTPHERFVDLFQEHFPSFHASSPVLDLGCGPGDVCIRFAKRFEQVEIHGLDGAKAMLAEGQRRLAKTDLAERVRLFYGYLPGASLPESHYATIISNSLLHHLKDPMLLWNTISEQGTSGSTVFVMDLMRPAAPELALAMVEQYAADEPQVLRQDFLHSLHAAYTLDEVKEQLYEARLALSVEAVSDRHLIVWGRL